MTPEKIMDLIELVIKVGGLVIIVVIVVLTFIVSVISIHTERSFCYEKNNSKVASDLSKLEYGYIKCCGKDIVVDHERILESNCQTYPFEINWIGLQK